MSNDLTREKKKDEHLEKRKKSSKNTAIPAKKPEIERKARNQI